jgi:enediyne biosynthesis thioesterase
MKPYFECQHLVTFADTNLVGNVYFVNYLSWQGECRERFLAEHAPGVLAQLAGDLALVTVSCTCSFLSELYAMDLVAVRMSLRDIQGSQIAMEFDYYRVNRGPAELVARGEQVVACMTRRGGELFPAPVPAELEQALARYGGHAASGTRERAGILALAGQDTHA